jgi:hypothetical protein
MAAEKSKTYQRGTMQKVSSKTCAVVTAIALSFSATAWAQPLSPGKPAGVRAAQLGDKELLVFGGVVVVLAAVLIANNGSGSHQSVAVQPITVVAPSTT